MKQILIGTGLVLVLAFPIVAQQVPPAPPQRGAPPPREAKVVRIDPAFDAIVGATANVAWGDNDGKTLYITARTSVYRIRFNIAGKQPCC